ncbi:hypothetical protein [uncultured Gammaproteobacteria bacterium]|nr:hypothetical protein [uncultured Gammaproteobacteria bacterium]CAC9588585.1 hypothetical protein [uncultured Gammaproteobacteria bacterium]
MAKSNFCPIGDFFKPYPSRVSVTQQYSKKVYLKNSSNGGSGLFFLFLGKNTLFSAFQCIVSLQINRTRFFGRPSF